MSTQYLEFASGTIAYDDTGEGQLAVCIPGLGDLRSEYRLLVPRLVQAGYRVVTLDVRGHGETSANWPDYTVAAIGSDVLALIKHLQAGPALLVGTSMGAAAAICAAVDGPEMVKALVLIGPFVRVLGPRWKSALMAGVVAGPWWGVAVWCKYFPTLFPTTRPADFAEYLAKLKKNLKEPGRLHALRAMLADNKAGSDARLDQVKVLVHLLMGTRDPDFKQPEQEVRLIKQRLSATRTTSHMIEGAGHYPQVEMPDEAAASILDFFDSAVLQSQPQAAR